jgi:DNA-binding transcriptional MerR regulator
MPYKERKVQKLYYSIGEVAKIFEVNTSLIRFWEKEFDILKPKKNKKGNRLFTKDDLENLKRIFVLVKEKGFTLEGAKKELKEGSVEIQSAAPENNQELASKLKVLKEKLLELEHQL